MSGPTGGIYISYRRGDSRGTAGRLYDDLKDHFGPDRVFRDLDAVPAGDDYTRVIEEFLASCEAVVVVIGNQWLDIRDNEGRQRLFQEGDPVVEEIAIALLGGKHVIPVLVEDAQMPARSKLPPVLADLTRRNALPLSDARWDYDVERLIRRLEQVFSNPPPPASPVEAVGDHPDWTAGPGAEPAQTAAAPHLEIAAEPPIPKDAGESSGHVTLAQASEPELSDGVRAVLGEALMVRARNPYRTEQIIQPSDVLLGALLRAARRGGGGSAYALLRSLPEDRRGVDGITAALTALGIEATEDAAPVDQVPRAARDVVAAAARCSQRTSATGHVSTRHLMAASLLADPDARVLEALRTTQLDLISALWTYLQSRWPDEAPEAWEELLSGSPAGAAEPQAPLAPDAPPPILDADAQRLLQMAASLTFDGGNGVDAALIVIGALAYGGEPSLAAGKEMLAWLVRDDANQVAGAELASRLVAITGQSSVHLAAPPDLDAPATAPLITAAAEQAQSTTGRPEVGARHLIGAAVMALDADSNLGSTVVAAVGTVERLRAALCFAVQRTAPDDSGEEWNTILFGPNQQLGGGYSRDVGWPDPGDVDDTKDSLGRQDEAEMFASLITDEKLVPPLAIGLFGSWGSGKSFFMKLIYRAVAAKAPDRSYAQIRFNAWHYSDANLWASLADEIFEQLADHVRAPEEDPEAARRRALELESEARKSIKARRDQVVAEQERLRTDLKEAATKRERARAESALAYATRLAVEISKDPAARSDLETVSKALGLAEPVDAYRALAGEASYLRDETAAITRGTSGRLRWSLLAAAIGLVVVAALAAFMPGAVRAWGSATATAVAAALALGARVVGSAGKVTAAARRFYERAVVVDERVRSAPTHEEALLTGQLREAEAAESAAATQLAEVDARIAALEAQLIELSGERRLYRFLIERADSNDYKGQLGIISVIRKDLETLLVHLQRKQAELVLRRIVLYIDDLDRCEPKDVVAVLQAVNLLLGTSLFVVVLGVDPTWLERSLRSQYSGLVAGSTPREYLEKIIQLPYVLPAMTDGFSSLMGALVGPLAVEPPARRAPAAATSNGAAHVPTVGAEGATVERAIADSLPMQESITVEAGSAAASGGAAGPVQAPTAPTRPELEMLVAMRPLVRTPRAATRLVNLYRLVRTTRDVGRSSRFLGTDGSPADYLVVIPLLAVATRSPEVLAELNLRLLPHEDGPQTWAQLLAAPGPQRLQPEWDEIVTALNSISEQFGVPSDLEPYRTWAPKLSRFTFTLTPQPGARPARTAADAPTAATIHWTTGTTTGQL